MKPLALALTCVVVVACSNSRTEPIGAPIDSGPDTSTSDTGGNEPDTRREDTFADSPGDSSDVPAEDTFDASLPDSSDAAYDGTYAEVGRCYMKGSSPSSGISCAAGNICASDLGDTGLVCYRDDATPLGCGPIGCGYNCVCGDVPAGECACTYLTSTARAKREIAYVDESTEKRLHDDVMSVRLATYRYKPGVTGEDAQHLGFIIEDMPQGSPAVLTSRDRVDLYGYVSMAVAALKVQERELDALKKRIAQLEASGCGGSK